MDQFDQATEREERDRALAIAAALKARPGPAATGACLSPRCGEALEGGRRFCDADCRDEFDRKPQIHRPR